MTHRQEAFRDVAGCRDIATRWCALAEQRLQHLSEMFETGRWRRYHSEIAFLENIQEAKRAVQTWRALATGADVAAAAASVTPAFGWSPATMPRVFPREQVQTVQPKAVRIAPETAVPVRLNPKPGVLAEITEAPIAPLAVPAAMAPLAASAATTPPKASAAVAPFKAPAARAPRAAPAAMAPLTTPAAMTPPKAPAAVAPLKAPAARAPL
ncbi:TIGR03809 family protein, partial [Bradyrhizobium sp. AS23.2]|uniref:TIGR03809 family protein n=1 Tax=Bradyrhizobium sp. AS23.2 TaxID=1680155 RepID=UPI00116139CA